MEAPSLIKIAVFLTAEQKQALDEEMLRLRVEHDAQRGSGESAEANINRSYVLRKLINECLLHDRT